MFGVQSSWGCGCSETWHGVSGGSFYCHGYWREDGTCQRSEWTHCIECGRPIEVEAANNLYCIACLASP